MSKPATVEICFCDTDAEGVLIVYTATADRAGGGIAQLEPGESRIVQLGEHDSLAVSRGHVE